MGGVTEDHMDYAFKDSGPYKKPTKQHYPQDMNQIAELWARTLCKFVAQNPQFNP